MSYRASVVKVPDYSSSSFSTEGFSVYKNVQTGIILYMNFFHGYQAVSLSKCMFKSATALLYGGWVPAS